MAFVCSVSDQTNLYSNARMNNTPAVHTERLVIVHRIRVAWCTHNAEGQPHTSTQTHTDTHTYRTQNTGKSNERPTNRPEANTLTHCR